MLEHVPKVVGEALAGARAGMDKVTANTGSFAALPSTIEVTSPAFTNGAPMPARFTSDGAKVSPPLAWRGVPPGTAALVLVVEDPDAPALEPLVHAMVLDLPADDGTLSEAGLASAGAEGRGFKLGKNSFLKSEYLPPDPPTGHGVHRYVFQVFALDSALDLPDGAGRSAVHDAMAGHALAKGVLIGTYERP